MSEASLTASGDGRWEVAGTLNFASVPQLWPSLQKLLQAGGRLTLSLAGVSQANSAGLVMLVEARHLARQAGCKLQLADVPGGLLDLARMSRCEEWISENGV